MASIFPGRFTAQSNEPFVVFLIVKAANTVRRKPTPVVEVAPPEPTGEEKLLTEIRDLLKK